MRFQLYFRLVLLLFCYFLGACFVFFLFRLNFLIRFGDLHEISVHYKWDLFESFWMGARFDAKVLAISLAPLFVLCALSLPFPKVSRNLIFFCWPWLVLQSLLLYFLLFIDQLYYGYFQNHIDIRIFGFMEDDTRALLDTFWQEYPVLPVLSLLFSLSVLTAWLLWKLHVRLRNRKVPACFSGSAARISFVIFTLLFVSLAARGSLGVFPLANQERGISDHQFLNLLAYNGIFSFYDAFQHRIENRFSTDMAPVLARYEHKDLREALRNYYQLASPQAPFRRYMFRKSETAFSAPDRKYHVILIIMESWSGYYFRWHSPSFHLLGRLEKHWDSLLHFPYFFSAENGTILGLESLLIKNSGSILSQTKYASHSFDTAITRPFLKAGYETHFISSGKLAWRNLDLFLPMQGFEKLSGQAKLESLRKDEDAQNNVWGVFDGYMFDFMLETLRQAEKPQFMVALSITHHPPYRTPDEYQPSALQIPPALSAKLKTDKDTARRAFLSFQYANDALGYFLEQIEQSNLAKETLVVMTGDHNTWGLLDYDQENLHWKYAVPLLFYLPPELKEKVSFADHQRFGSHDDIFPTLMALLFPEEEFLQTGYNLLAPQRPPSFAVNAAGWALDPQGAVSLTGQPLFYKWSSPQRQKLVKSVPRPELMELRKRAQARKIIMNYALRADISGEQARK